MQSSQRPDRLSAAQKSSVYKSVIQLIFLIIAPLFSILLEWYSKYDSIDPVLIGKWFIFWSNGIYLLASGSVQAYRSYLYDKSVFKPSNSSIYLVSFRLGFLKICMSISGLLSVGNKEWRTISAITGICFWGCVTLWYLFKKADTLDELIAEVTSLVQVGLMMLYLCFIFLY